MFNDIVSIQEREGFWMFKIFKQEIITKQHNFLNALVISDLHIFNSCDISTMEAILEHLRKQKHDVIYLVGDIIDSTSVHPPLFSSLSHT